MYQDLRKIFWWRNMKRSIGSFVQRRMTRQQVKAEHQRPSGLLKPLEIPEWKWEHITMDFVTGLPRTTRGNEAIWVIVDRMTKSAHFLPVKMTYKLDKLAQIYQATIKMAPYEALYGRKCRSPLYWDKVGEKRIIGPDIVEKTVEKIDLIKNRIKIAQDRQKSYVDKRRKDLVFQIGDKVFLKIPTNPT
ncbi:hypothetical protein DH2020_026717 [Rehmannia glutinosa]|uniref:Retrotransposon protein, putative, Ty3-gypsy subclass n=1 Tax=Rehmannia glutinosa TaxID=99300 RepID=A0ABR0W014_REHGL